MIPVLVTDVLLGAAPGACCEHEVLHQLMRLYLARRAAMDRLCDEQHISRTAAAALHEIVLAELLAAPLTPSALAAALGITNASVSAIVRSLTDAGLVVRERNMLDRRSVLLTAAPDAVRPLRAAKQEVTRVASELTDEEASTLVSFFDAIADVISPSSHTPHS